MTLSTRKKTKFIHEGPYVAEVDVEVIVEENEWAPYLSLEDAYKVGRRARGFTARGFADGHEARSRLCVATC